MLSDQLTRRQLVTSGGVLLIAGMAGCIGSDTAEDDETPTVPEEPPSALQLNDRALSPAFPFELVDPNADVENIGSHVTGEALIAHVQYHDPEGSFSTHWHFDPLEVPLNDTRRARARFVYTDYTAVSLGGDSPYRLNTSTPSEANTEVINVTVDTDIVSFSGESVGTTERIFELVDTNAGNVDWATPPLEIVVSDQNAST